MNAGLPAGAGVLFAGEARGSFYRGRLAAATVFDFPVLADVCAESATTRDVNRKLKQMGLTHVFFNWAEAQRISGYGIFDWPTPRARDLFERWWTGHLSLAWKAGWLAVYEISPSGVKECTAPVEFVHAPAKEFQELSGLERAAVSGIQQGRGGDALESARELVRRAPRAALAREVLAQAFACSNQDRKALDEFRRAVASGMVSSQAHYNIYVLLRRLGRPEEAAREYQKYLEVDSRYSRMNAAPRNP